MNKKLGLREFDDTDIIALVVIIGCFILRIMGRNGLVEVTMASIIGFYFGGKFRK